ncbi:MAG: GNAT family N-acetyltransferase [Pyrinomonadaceae bacterium]
MDKTNAAQNLKSLIKPEKITFRAIDWPADQERLEAFDASFTTDRAYRLRKGDMAARFIVEELGKTLTKRYDTSGIGAAVEESEFSLIAEAGADFAAFMTVKYEDWNRRALITHLYVLPRFKGDGIGRSMVERAIDFARRRGARGLWLETQNFNYPAIQFYLNLGFRFCGFDENLYDPSMVPGETAIYLGVKF